MSSPSGCFGRHRGHSSFDYRNARLAYTCTQKTESRGCEGDALPQQQRVLRGQYVRNSRRAKVFQSSIASVPGSAREATRCPDIVCGLRSSLLPSSSSPPTPPLTTAGFRAAGSATTPANGVAGKATASSFRSTKSIERTTDIGCSAWTPFHSRTLNPRRTARSGAASDPTAPAAAFLLHQRVDRPADAGVSGPLTVVVAFATFDTIG